MSTYQLPVRKVEKEKKISLSLAREQDINFMGKFFLKRGSKFGPPAAQTHSKNARFGHPYWAASKDVNFIDWLSLQKALDRKQSERENRKLVWWRRQTTLAHLLNDVTDDATNNN